jgi:hypothetical protein
LRGSEALLVSAFVFRIRVCSSLLPAAAAAAAAVFSRFYFFCFGFISGAFCWGLSFVFFFFFGLVGRGRREKEKRFDYGVVGCGGKAPSDTSAGIK